MEVKVFRVGRSTSDLTPVVCIRPVPENDRQAYVVRRFLALVQIPVHRGQSFRRIADSVPVIADSFR